MESSIYPRFTLLTFLCSEFNSLAENRKSDVIDFKYLYSGIEQKNLVSKLANEFGDIIDLSILQSDTLELDKFYNCLDELKNTFKGQERKKFNIVKNGINLLVAFIIELIQRQSHEKTNSNEQEEKKDR